MKTNKQAFTLIELLVVVIIIGILAAVAVPQYQKAVEKARFQEAYLNGKAWVHAQQIYYLANNDFTTSLDLLDISLDLPSSEEAATTGAPYGYDVTSSDNNPIILRITRMGGPYQGEYLEWALYNGSTDAGRVFHWCGSANAPLCNFLQE